MLRPAVTAILLLSCDCQAALSFDHDREALNVQFGVTEVSARFPFRNTGSQAVTVTELKTSCGCTAATIGAKTYAPGEDGVIEAVMKLAKSATSQTKHVYVRTDADPDSPIELTISATVDLPLKVTPTMLVWRLGDDPTAKEAWLEVDQEEPVRILDLSTNNDDFKVALEKIEDGRRYRVIGTPTTTREIKRTIVTLQTDDAKGKYHVTLATLIDYQTQSEGPSDRSILLGVIGLLVVGLGLAVISRVRDKRSATRPAPAPGLQQ